MKSEVLQAVHKNASRNTWWIFNETNIYKGAISFGFEINDFPWNTFFDS